jgi:hypothetical protein
VYNDGGTKLIKITDAEGKKFAIVVNRPYLFREISVLLDELTQALPTLSPSQACPFMSPHPCSAPFTPVFLNS